MKVIRRLLPVQRFDFSALEGWLEAMAARGLYLESFGKFLATFRRGAPARVRYRLEPMAAKDAYPGVERLSAYAESGWAYLRDGGELYHIYLTEDPEAPELHTDPVTLDHMLSILDRRNRQENILCILALLLNLFGLREQFLSLPHRPWTPIDVLLVLALAFVAVVIPYRFGQMRRLRRQLQAGIPLEHGGDWRRARLLHCAGMLFVLVIASLLLYSIFSL